MIGLNTYLMGNFEIRAVTRRAANDQSDPYSSPAYALRRLLNI
ncbi:hypothetical protein FIU97_04990 [Roseivivax sp. THAF40]|nr:MULTISPECIES: hypothetical protein [unclassified Roseivivax]QFS82128.1 hypothetical protein FIV09_04730 [Roseivivax sp. THAF197b]QFT45928.1 hypothetical protein FIU97_04990 [Roseivivax sp. THAF40]